MFDFEDMLCVCSKVMGVLLLLIQGWFFEFSKCDGRVLVVIYYCIGNSMVVDLIVVSQYLFVDCFVFVIDNGNIVVLKVDLKVVIGSDELLQLVDDVLQVFISYLYCQGVEFKLLISQEIILFFFGVEVVMEQ